MRWLTGCVVLAAVCGPLGSAPDPGARSRAKAARQCVEKLFKAMREGRFDLWEFPALTWADIPALLEKASSRASLADPSSSPLSSVAMKECFEGTVALWLIEAIRRGGREPSLNPDCRQAGEYAPCRRKSISAPCGPTGNGGRR